MAAAALALVIANSPLSHAYFKALQLTTGPVLTPKLGPMTVHLWINDGLMAVFFLLVGLEIKREFIDGQLSSRVDRRLPFIAAAAGMALPAISYLVITRSAPQLTRGWAIPAATDIAFTLGLLAMLGKRVPTSLKLFVTTVAIVDDVGAVAIIALFYIATLDWTALGAASLVVGGMFGMNRAGVKHPVWYFAAFALLWYFMLRSGVHATVAGILAAAAVPITSRSGRVGHADSTLHRIEQGLQPWVAFAVVPLFGFANAGVTLAGDVAPFALLPLAIALGLFVGKQVGVFGSVWLAVKLRLATRPSKASWAQVHGVALLCGVGFTMSLFIGGLAFPEQPQADAVKIGVLIGSLLSATTGVAVLQFARSGR